MKVDLQINHSVELHGTHKGSLVHKFITSGKAGYCELCKKAVLKLEAHHIKYSPEVIIKLCHDCHHKVHFWPLRVSQKEKLLILKKVFPESLAEDMSKFKFSDVSRLAKLIAPSRKAFIHAAQKLDEKLQLQTQRTPQKIQLHQFKRKNEVIERIKEIPHLKDKKKSL